ncbi:MAG: M23 family metallopeptidase [Ruminococcus sp.]|nr:M23 family metallopeptidase [Ruminococcus sp.]
MNSPYMGKFRVTQCFKGSAHDGLDLVGIDSKDIHATADGTIVYAAWENASDHYQGFGQYVVIKGDKLINGKTPYYHYGHLSQIKVKNGQKVKCTDVIGIEGSTGKSTGSHCHYCVRTSLSPGTFLDVCSISGIPNVEGGVYDDGYKPGEKKSVKVTVEFEDHQYSSLLEEI